MSIKSSAALALFAVLGLSAVLSQEAAAQNSRDSRGRDQVCVYEHANFRGWEQCFGAGESDRDLGDRRNSISSVRVMGGAQISLFEHPQFGGREVKIDRDVPDLSRAGGWNDQVDSLRVSGGRGDGPRGGRPRNDRDQGDRVCVYEHAGFQGNSRCFDFGDDERDLGGIGWNDRISSIRVFGGRSRIAIYEHNDFGGADLVIDRDIPDLTRIQWNDRISSLRVGDGRWNRRRH